MKWLLTSVFKNYYSPKRRAIMALGDNINHLEVFKRDNWTCGICHEPINPKLRCPDKWCATIDHVIPLKHWTDSIDRWHRLANVQAAHWLCNMSKSDKLDAAGMGEVH